MTWPALVETSLKVIHQTILRSPIGKASNLLLQLQQKKTHTAKNSTIIQENPVVHKKPATDDEKEATATQSRQEIWFHRSIAGLSLSLTERKPN